MVSIPGYTSSMSPWQWLYLIAIAVSVLPLLVPMFVLKWQSQWMLTIFTMPTFLVALVLNFVLLPSGAPLAACAIAAIFAAISFSLYCSTFPVRRLI